MPSENDPPRNRPWGHDDRGRGDDDDRPRRRDREDDEYDDRPRRRRDRDDDYDDRPQSGSNGIATAGLVLGIIALCAGPLAGIPALICSGIGLGRPGGRGAAIAGIILGGFGTLIMPFILIGLLLPAVSSVRSSAARMHDQNNLKQIGLGFHSYDMANGQLPPAEGEVSWRVHLLPYIEQNTLYQQFDPKQPWDSPANKKLASQRIPTYVSAIDPPETVETHYRVFVGPNTLFPPGERPYSLNRITDGAANTILAVEASETVPWPQPKELPYDRNGPLPQLGVPGRKGFIVAMADGSVRFVSDKVSPDAIRAGIEPNDGRRFDAEP